MAKDPTAAIRAAGNKGMPNYKYKPKRSVVFLMTDKHEIEDVMNEIYFQLWRSIDNYDANRPFRLWLYGIAMKQIQTRALDSPPICDYFHNFIYDRA